MAGAAGDWTGCHEENGRVARQIERMTMAKGQKRSGREPKKPKTNKKKKGQAESGLNLQSKVKPAGM